VGVQAVALDQMGQQYGQPDQEHRGKVLLVA